MVFILQKRRLVNYLNFLLFCSEHNLDASETFRKKSELFHNGGLRIGLIPFARKSDIIKISSWKHVIYNEIIAKFKKDIEDKLTKAKEVFEEVEGSLFVDEEVLEEDSIKILFLVNTCGWSEQNVTLKDNKKSVSYEDYALMHMKVIPQYLEGEPEISIGYVHSGIYGYNPKLYSQNEFTSYLKPMKSFKDLENSIYNSPGTVKDTCSTETMSGVLKHLKSNGIEYDFIFFFTDGYGNNSTDQSAVSNHFPNTRFIFKAMNPSAGSWAGYRDSVPREGKDIILNTEYYSPRYQEYFDSKKAMMTFEKMIEEIDKL
ncbi:hypothetical protein N9N67_00095 [Bacteriovoracaceae bacterium]|nr:hypothetical protein [Bacteriovoracaceae bacterium]